MQLARRLQYPFGVMNKIERIQQPKPSPLKPLLISLLILGSVLSYGALRWRTPSANAAQLALPEREAGGAAALSSGGATPPSGGASGEKGGQPAPGGENKTVMLKMEPILANLDEGDQVRYLRVTLQLEVQGDAQQRAQGSLPRARHDVLMYLSGLHVADTQGLVGKQRIHRELQRRIADAVGGGLKRIYFDEFVVQ